jgi:hypothetical protein
MRVSESCPVCDNFHVVRALPILCQRPALFLIYISDLRCSLLISVTCAVFAFMSATRAVLAFVSATRAVPYLYQRPALLSFMFIVSGQHCYQSVSSDQRRYY